MNKRVAKKVKRMSVDSIANRVKKMLEYRKEFLAHIDDVHIKPQKGNHKTGRSCYTFSMIPIADCPAKCMEENGCGKTGCYDVQNVCYQPCVQKDRARNSAVHMADPARYWKEIGDWCEVLSIDEARLNVGGDLTDDDFFYVRELGLAHPNTDFLFFTKNDDGLNKFLDVSDFPQNIHYLVSFWPGLCINNPHNVPEAHIVWADGSSTLPKDAPKQNVHLCDDADGNCSDCHSHNKNCWKMRKSDTVTGKQYQVLFAH